MPIVGGFQAKAERFPKELDQLKCDLETVLRKTNWFRSDADNLPDGRTPRLPSRNGFHADGLAAKK